MRSARTPFPERRVVEWVGCGHRSAHAECGERLRPDEAVDREVAAALVAHHRAPRPLGEMSVDAARPEAPALEEELEDGDVPADVAAHDQVALAEERSSEPAELAARDRAGDSVDDDADVALEAPDSAGSHGPRDAVDRARVEAARLERDLETRDLRVRDGVRRSRQREHCGHGEAREKGLLPHGTDGFRRSSRVPCAVYGFLTTTSTSPGPRSARASRTCAFVAPWTTTRSCWTEASNPLRCRSSATSSAGPPAKRSAT